MRIGSKMGKLSCLILAVATFFSPSPVPVLGAYKLVSPLTPTPFGFNGSLSISSPGLDPSRDIPSLTLSIYLESDSRLRVRLTDSLKQRWELPRELLAVPETTISNVDPTKTDYEIKTVADPFGFQVLRRSNGQVIFDSTSTNLVYSDLYLEMSTSLTSDSILYGLGERIDNLRLSKDENYTIWSRDWGNPTHDNLYGSHPFYLQIEDQNVGDAHGVFLANTNGMQIQYTQTGLTYRVIGGVLDFYFFMGPTAKQVVEQYTELIGKPYLPPIWSLGFHQCKWGYATLSNTSDVVSQYAAHELPLDTIWNDIDYMSYYYDFTFDPHRFPPDQLRSFTSELAAKHQHHVYIVDPAVPALLSLDQNRGVYGPYVRGKEQNVFVTVPTDDPSGDRTPLFSKVWPHVPVAFPDFTAPNSTSWWEQNIREWFELGGEASGLWIDMNEPSSFCFGQDVPSQPSRCEAVTGPGWSDSDPLTVDLDPLAKLDPTWARSDSSVIKDWPYQITKAGVNLEDKTINVSSHHYWSQHYNIHNLFGALELRATNLALTSITQKRPFVLTRSQYAGSGRYGAHWTGDNDSTFASLKGSLAHIMSLGIFGISFAGSDICGFGGNTTPELCTRWMQIGSLYPFSRNHNTWDSISQEPYVFEKQYVDINRASLQLRYSLLPYLYNQFFHSSVTGLGVWRPVWMEFEADPLHQGLYDLQSQVMIGSSLMVSPVLDAGVTSLSVVFPPGIWYEYHTGVRIVGGVTSTVDAALDTLPLHIVGGSIIPTQTANLTTYTTRLSPYKLTVAPCAMGHAMGELIVDDGESLTTLKNEEYWKVEYEARVTVENVTHIDSNGNKTIEWKVEGFVSSTFAHHYDQLNPLSSSIDSIVIFGLSRGFPIGTNLSISAFVKIGDSSDQIEVATFHCPKRDHLILRPIGEPFSLGADWRIEFTTSIGPNPNPPSPPDDGDDSRKKKIVVGAVIGGLVGGGLLLGACIWFVRKRKNDAELVAAIRAGGVENGNGAGIRSALLRNETQI